ncbi:MAG: 3-phosphoshikimate 1-carboxyvinyltransferase [Desulfobacterales bacterium]|nr:MAG: 3-phosphoshikimate 1-carboxyvinyltransferase [Desulfobacterales bacterium]
MIAIKSQKISNCQIIVPGSKSYTHRMLIAAALSDGMCTIKNALISEDTQFTIEALKQMGIRIESHDSEILVYGKSGHMESCDAPIYLGNSGTSMRLLTAVAALGDGTYTLAGTERMGTRPIQDLLDALQQIGVRVRCLNKNGCPPIKVSGGSISGDRVGINCQKSSQFLSALLLIAPYTRMGLEIRVTKGPVSRPYVDLTIELMKTFGISIKREGYLKFKVPGAQVYRAGEYMVEADCSQAGYFWGAAAITGAEIKVVGIDANSPQGDVRFVDLLQSMGCQIYKEKDGIRVLGGPLSAIEADLCDMPDLVPTLSVVAAFAKGTTVIRNVAHLKTKESDRLTAVVAGLTKMGIKTHCTENALIVKGGNPRGSIIDTYNDHRIAMSFAIAGLNVPGVYIRGESCVEKSFPTFWQVFEGLYR